MCGTPRAHGGILIVDDHADIRDSLAEILAEEGYQVACAANGREALEHLRTCPRLPCLILLDLMMPVMNGWDFRALQRNHPRFRAVPVAIVSGADVTAHCAGALDAVDYIVKPVELRALMATIALHC
jgi:CheY-like chemotaxis protein